MAKKKKRGLDPEKMGPKKENPIQEERVFCFKKAEDSFIKNLYFLSDYLFDESRNVPSSEFYRNEQGDEPVFTLRIDTHLLSKFIQKRNNKTDDLDTIIRRAESTLLNMSLQEIIKVDSKITDHIVFIEYNEPLFFAFFKELKKEYKKRFSESGIEKKESKKFIPLKDGEITLKGTTLTRESYPPIVFQQTDSAYIKILESAIEAKGGWFEVGKTSRAKNIKNFRPAVGQLNDRLKSIDLILVSTRNDNMEGKPQNGAGAYHLAKIDKEP